MERLGVCLAFLFFCLIVSDVSARTGNETDKLALLEFKAMITGDPLGLLRSWNDSMQLCSWPGITCGRKHQRVVALDLRRWNLKGQLSPHVGNLSFLKALHLSDSGFSHEIPPEIGRLSRLRVINFRNNSFAGEIPANITGCPKLQMIYMDFNNLTGRIPEGIGLLSELSLIFLSSNNLAGEIPVSIGNLSSLERLYLSENHLQGTIPTSLSRLTRVTVISIRINNLTGTVPPSLYNVSTIENFAVAMNQLEGSIPRNVGLTLPNLRYFLFYENKFSGALPETISNASNLVIFQVQGNSLTGNLPNFAKFSNLEKFGAGQNNLGYAKNDDMKFLRGIVNCTNLLYLAFMDNNLGGTIPESIGNVTRTKLKGMAFGTNQISGNIPSGIGNLINLEVLAMEGNHLTGPIPISIGKLRKLNFLSVDTNQLSGTIPASLQNLTSISTMCLGRNNLQGSIPPSLGDCKNLQALSLASNNLSGPIPSQLLRLSSLTRYLDLSSNRLNGSIPIEVGKLVNLGNLDISENRLSGEIPKALGSCLSMEFLQMQGNFLEGPIPTELDSLRGLQMIDFSRNNLSGQIPMYFEEFRGFLYLNLSFNEFEGELPQGGVFQNASKFSITGNTRLCGGLPELKLGSCPSNISRNRTIPRKAKVAIVVSCSVIGFILVLSALVVLIISRSKNRSASTLESSNGVSLPRISYGDLSKATNRFSSSNMIGVGRFGSVFKGIQDHTTLLVAVKVLNLHVSSALKSFVLECESLRVIKHRNVVKLVTVCSSIDFQGKDFKALVYEFMENGNLDEWLHSSHSEQQQQQQQQQSRRLNLIQRIQIAIDVASALDYLHNLCHEPIAHCDIKPSNILLDGELVAHVGDFGLAKLLRSVEASSSANQISSAGVRGTVGYVAPEYAMGSEVSTSGDIYSFGIVLLEIFTGKRPTDNMFKDDFSLNSYASMALPGRITEIIDPMLLEVEEEEEVTSIENDTRGSVETAHMSLISVIEIGVACSSKFPDERRNIGDVIAELSKIRDTLHALRRI